MATTQGPNPGLDTPHQMLLTDAAIMQADYAKDLVFQNQPAGGFFFRSGIVDILTSAICIGIRYYFILEAGVLKVILLGVESQNSDITDIIIGNAQTDPPYGNNDSITSLNQVISLEDAIDLTAAFQTEYDKRSPGGFFDRSIFDYFIGVNDVIGIRYKFGINRNDELKLIINPVNSDFYDMDMFNVTGQKIRGEISDGGGGGGSPLVIS
ncbi:MAG: hypothetical protein ABI723_00465 [Bacteroidia bacterium]